MTGETVAVYLAAAIAALFALALLLAAVTLTVRALTQRRAARVARLEAGWTPQLLEVLAGDRPSGALTAGIAERDRAAFTDFLLRFVRRLRGPERETLAALAEPFLEDVAPGATGGSAEARALAVQMLGTLGPVRHAAAVRAALDDPSPLVAMTAARALATRENAAHLGAILERLPRFAEWSPAFLASLLAAVGPAAAPALRELLADVHRSPGDRAVAADALRMLHDLASADVASAVVASARDSDLLAAALRLLGAVGGAPHAPAVRAACASADPVVRAQACAAMGAIGGPEDRERLRAALDDGSAWVVLHAARSLEKVGGNALLLAAADRPGVDLLRQVAAEARR